MNPWIGLYRLLTAAGRLRRRREHPPLAYPAWAGHWPAVAGFLAFAWFELIHPAPSDPAVLARAVASYLLFQLAGVLAFGERWLREGGAVLGVLPHGVLARAARRALLRAAGRRAPKRGPRSS